MKKTQNVVKVPKFRVYYELFIDVEAETIEEAESKALEIPFDEWENKWKYVKENPES